MKHRVRTLAVTGAFLLATAATPAVAQGNLLNDWGIDDLKQAFTNVGVTVTDSGVEDSGALYVAGKTAEGMKFLAYGTVCSDALRRCKGLNLSAGFTQDSNAEVDRRVKEIDRMAIGVRNGGENSLDVNRYIIFDDGITRKNLEMNIQVFLDISEDIWSGGGT
ncbi:MAG: hypothetical protein Q8J89_11540 [Caulobacter sp.]|nr:hypothetical protein [Caulobacter sp.]